LDGKRLVNIGFLTNNKQKASKAIQAGNNLKSERERTNYFQTQKKPHNHFLFADGK
jgi:hypothetical protein